MSYINKNTIFRNRISVTLSQADVGIFGFNSIVNGFQEQASPVFCVFLPCDIYQHPLLEGFKMKEKQEGNPKS